MKKAAVAYDIRACAQGREEEHCGNVIAVLVHCG